MLLLNLLLALLWASLRNSFSPIDLLVGFLLGFIIISTTQQTLGIGDYSQRTWLGLRLIGFSLWTIIRSSMALAHIISMPVPQVRPGIVAVPLDIKKDLTITLLVYLVSLIPGTLGITLSRDRGTLYIHTISVNNPDDFRRAIKEELEQRVARLMYER
jgi:multicomponent Na+:H+ antiporter subunit E